MNVKELSFLDIYIALDALIVNRIGGLRNALIK